MTYPVRLLSALALAAAATSLSAQSTVTRAPSELTAEQDRQLMMEKLGITALVPGPSGDDKAPNHANYDEAVATPYPKLPDPLVTNAGRPVTTARDWWQTRRPEILAAYAREVYGEVPDNAPAVRWTVTGTDHEVMGFPFTPVIARQVVGHVDNRADPSVTVDIRLTVVTPADAHGPVPLLVMFGRDGYPNPAQPSREEFERIDAALKKAVVREDSSLAAVFAAHPAFTLATEPPFHFPVRAAGEDPPTPEQLIAAGWGYALLDPASIQADNGAGLTRGVIGLANKGQPRRPEQWGALRAWAWGASRALDFLAADPAIDAKHIGIEGVSRYGKAALVTMAFDQRFAMALVGSSGKGGATPLRRNFGEAVSNLATGEYYWFAGNFLKYDTKGVSPPNLDADDLPVDSNELIALCAPRLTFISYGVPEAGDAKWLDQRGSFMATVNASRVWNLLGAPDLAVTEDYRRAQLPPPTTGLLQGNLAWRQHTGGHTDAPNVKYFIAWVDAKIGYRPSALPGS